MLLKYNILKKEEIVFLLVFLGTTKRVHGENFKDGFNIKA